MALQMTINKFGNDVVNAYHRVKYINITETYVNVQMVTLVDSNGDEEIENHNFQFDYDPNGGEPKTQAYTFIKALPEFASATDV